MKTQTNWTKGLFFNHRILLRLILSCICILPVINLVAQTGNDEESEVFDLPEYSVYAQAAESAVEAQRESNIIGSYLGSDALADLPDDDLGEALSRLAGVNVIGGAGTDAAFVTVRGAEGQYNTIRINGAAPANAKLGDRGFDLNQIPTEMVRSVEVVKSITAEYPGDSIGGTVNVTTATAFSLQQPIGRYKVEARFQDLNDEYGWGANYRYSNIYDLGSGEDNFGVFLNVNYVHDELTVWNTQNRFLDQTNRIPTSRDPNFESFARQTILSVNPDAHIPIWDRFDPDERRVRQDELTINASFDFKLSDKTILYIRPWFQKGNNNRDQYAPRLDRIERAFERNVWFFLDEAGNPLGEWVDDDGDGVLGSEGDSFINAVDSSGELIMTQSYEANRDGRIRRIVTNRGRDTLTWTLDLGGETYFEDATLDYRIYYSVDDEDELRQEWRFQRDFRNTSGGLAPLRLRMLDGTTPTPDFIAFEVTESRGHVPSNNYRNAFGDLDNVNTHQNLYAFEDVHEDRLLAEINFDHQVSENFKYKTGLRYLKATRENFAQQFFMQPAAGPGNALPASEMIDPATQTGGPVTLYNGQYKDTHGPFLLVQPFFDYFLDDLAANPENWAFDRSDMREAADTADLEEEISAAFLQGTYRWKDLTIVAGVRYEKTQLDTTWKPSNFRIGSENIPGLSAQDRANIDALIVDWLEDNDFPGDSGTFSFGDWVDDVNRKNDYDNVLPGAVATWRVGDSGHVLRFAWTNTLTRPDPQQLIPFDLGLANQQLADAGVPPVAGREDDFRFGNPDLREQTSENWDLAWEYYFGPEQRNALSVTLFKKKLEDFLVEATFDREVEVLVDPGDPSQGTEFVTEEAEFWTNGSTANIEGIEVSGYFNLGNFFKNSDFMQGISFVPNYTYIKGDSMLPSFDQDELNQGNIVQTGEELIDGLIGQAEHIVNLQLFYETPRWNFRLSWNYVDEILRNSSTAALDSLERDEASSTLDLSIQYRLSKNSDMRLYVEIDNLTNEPQDSRYVGKTAGLYTQNYDEVGRRFVFGIRGSL